MSITIYAFYEPVTVLIIYPQDPDSEGLDWEEETWNQLVRLEQYEEEETK